MGWFDRMLGRDEPRFAKRAEPSRDALARAYARGRRAHLRYDAAAMDSDNVRHWMRGADALSADSANSLAVRKRIRSRVRYEADNNGYLTGIADTMQDDLIGQSPRIQLNRLGIPDKLAQRAEAEWMEWCDAAALDQLQIMARAKIIDGEAFGLQTANRALHTPVKLFLTAIECDQISDPDSSNDPRNVDGVRLDAAGNVVSYRMLNYHPGGVGASMDAVDVPAADMLHWFKRRRPGQHRGISDFAPCLELTALLRRYTLATVTTAEGQAATGGVMTVDPEKEDYDNSIDPEEVLNYERNSITALPPGWKFEGFDPTQPSSTMDAFVRTLLQEIGRSVNTPLVAVLMNASGFNFASGRLDHLIYRSHVKTERGRFARAVLQPLFRNWWREWRNINYHPSLPEAAPPVRFIFPGFEYIDIRKESSALISLRDAGAITTDDIWLQSGHDPEEMRLAVERDAAWRKRVGIGVEAERISVGEDDGTGETREDIEYE